MNETTGSKARSNESKNIRAALYKIESILVPGETLEAYAVQRRLFALTHRRMTVAATSGRYIILSRGLIGGFNTKDVRWQDVKDAKLKVGIIGASLTISTLGSSDLASSGQQNVSYVLGGLRKTEAEAVYRICQTQEQAWREKRRIRDLEELRAKSGGISLGSTASLTGTASPPGATATELEDPTLRLKRAKEMREQGLLSDSEYEAIKAKIVAGL